MLKINLYSFLTLICFSCIKEVDDVKLPDNYGKKIVVECYISPESDSVSATVTLSVPILGSNADKIVAFVDNAMVTLSDGNNSFNLPFDQSKNIYFIRNQPFPILPGKTYFLTVKTIDGKTVSAQCTVPLQAAIPTSLTVVRNLDNSSYPSDANIKAQWQDFPGEKNYYLVIISLKDPDLSYSYPQFMSLYGNTLTDEQRDGEVITYRENNVYLAPDDNLSYEVSLHTLEYNAYEFKRTQTLNGEDDPFSTPINVHSNIENGLGVFGAYRKMVLVK